MSEVNGGLQAVVFDWAGTIVDYGSRAPVAALIKAFARVHVPLSVDEARGPMGLPKRDHIATLLRQPAIAARYATAHGHAPREADVDALYDLFVPMNIQVIAEHGTLIEGVAALVANLRVRGLKIGSTTGYTRAIVAALLPVASLQGYAPDVTVCADEVAGGRPGPAMLQRCLAALGDIAPARAVKVDDTEPGIAEGREGGSWTVGVALSGNVAGHSLEEWQAIEPPKRSALREEAVSLVERWGCDYVIDTVADLPAVLDAIEARLDRGERPG